MRVYRDANNSPIPLGRLVRTEPEWAVSLIREYREKVRELEELIAEWKDASQLEKCGDPDGILPRHLAAYIAERDDELNKAYDAVVESARLGYIAGHHDTVESCYGDPLETAHDICEEMKGLSA